MRWLGEVTLHPPKTINDIVEPFAASMLALMPIHDALGRDDYRLLRDAMRTALTDIHDRFTKEVNPSELAKTVAMKT